jgi:flagellar basal body-associated protein FliL
VKKAVGYFLMGLGWLIFWPVQIGIAIYAIYYIITTFINNGVIAGLVSIPIAGICLAVFYFLVHIIAIPYSALVSSLLGTEKRQRELWERQRKEQEAEMLGAEDLKWQSETRKTLAELGMTTQEIENEMIKHDEEIGKDLVERFRNENKPELAKREIEQLRDLIKHHKNRYYNLDSPDISDVAYDYLKQRLHSLEEAYPQFGTQQSK